MLRSGELRRACFAAAGGRAMRSSAGAKHGADEVRTRDPLLAKQVLYQLSYDPIQGLYRVII